MSSPGGIRGSQAEPRSHQKGPTSGSHKIRGPEGSRQGEEDYAIRAAPFIFLPDLPSVPVAKVAKHLLVPQHLHATPWDAKLQVWLVRGLGLLQMYTANILQWSELSGHYSDPKSRDKEELGTGESKETSGT